MRDWKQIYQDGSVQDKPSEQIIQLVPKYKAEGVKRILDHGCGTGRHVKYLAEQGFYVVGTDYSESAIQHAKEITSELENVELVQSSMDSVSYPHDFFDATISSHVVQHAMKTQRDGAFHDIKWTLKSKGLLFLRTISRKHKVYGSGREIEPHTFIDIPELPDGKTPHHYFSEEELREYLQQFEILSLDHHSYPPDPNGFWTHGLEEWSILARKI